MKRMPWTAINLKRGKQIAENLITLYAVDQAIK